MRTTNGYRLMTTHGIRGDYTLCGIKVKDHQWFRDPPENYRPVARCSHCESVPPGYGTSCDLMNLGFTYRQIDYAVRQGLLCPVEGSPGSGGRRVFPSSEVATAAAMTILVTAGLSPRAAHQAVRNGGRLSSRVRVVVDEAAA